VITECICIYKQYFLIENHIMNNNNNNKVNDKQQRQIQRSYPFERFASVRSFTGFNFLNKDPSRIVYVADTNGQFNVWRQRSSLSSDGEPYTSYLIN
jgi:hypothetical protein